MDAAGVWHSDSFSLDRIFRDGRHEHVAPNYNVLTLEAAGDCLVTGVKSWSQGPFNGTQYVAGVIHAGTCAKRRVASTSRLRRGWSEDRASTLTNDGL